MSAPYVVVGAGQAGLQVCTSLRNEGYDGELVLVGEETGLPYQRPPLSKSFLDGSLDQQRLLFRPATYYDKLDIKLRLGCRATALDPATRSLTLNNAEVINYSQLALATGTRIRPLDCPGSNEAAIHYVRTLEDSQMLKPQLEAGKRLVVIGGGFIGLEVAAVARQLGLSVLVIETQERLMARAVSPMISDYYTRLHSDRGVGIRLNTGLRSIATQGDESRLTLTDGDTVAADVIVAGIGVIPNAELAASAGVECRNGIVVDASAKTNIPGIVAAGDCTMHYNGFLHREIRLESVQNAVDQAKVAAATMCGKSANYAQVPWFWSDQYECKLQIAGICLPYDHHVQRGLVSDDGFSIFYFRDNTLVGADSINRPAHHMAVRKLLALGAAPTLEQLGDDQVDLLQLAREMSSKTTSS